MNPLYGRGLKAFEELFFPAKCLRCLRPIEIGAGFPVCKDCMGTFERVNLPYCRRCMLPSPICGADCPDCLRLGEPSETFSIARSLSPYRGLSRDLVLALKYKRRKYLAPFLAMMLEDIVRPIVPADAEDFIFVPVPLHPLRLFARGFNQAELIASALAERFAVKISPFALKRNKYTSSLASLGKNERVEALASLIEPNRQFCGQIKGRCAVLIDDVLTTGATAAACAKALREAGASDVRVVTVCRTL